MSNEFLSQDEVDALLKGVEPDGEQAEPARPEDNNVQVYDRATQERIIRSRVPAMDEIHKRFSALLRPMLQGFMGRLPEIAPPVVQILKYEEFTGTLKSPSHINMVQMKPLRGNALFVLEPQLVHLIVESLFGGQGRIQPRLEARDFTPTEQSIAQRVLHLALDEYQKSWKETYPLACELLRTEFALKHCHIAAPSDLVVVITLKLEAGASGCVHICIPQCALEPIRGAVKVSAARDPVEPDLRWLQGLSRQVQAAEVELSANLVDLSLTVKQLLSMSVGDVLSVDMPRTITAAVDGVPIFDCRYGVVEGRYALRVENVLKTPTDTGSGAHHA
jgi:flagellar motor switch protein FliM